MTDPRSHPIRQLLDQAATGDLPTLELVRQTIPKDLRLPAGGWLRRIREHRDAGELKTARDTAREAADALLSELPPDYEPPQQPDPRELARNHPR